MKTYCSLSEFLRRCRKFLRAEYLFLYIIMVFRKAFLRPKCSDETIVSRDLDLWVSNRCFEGVLCLQFCKAFRKFCKHCRNFYKHCAKPPDAQRDFSFGMHRCRMRWNLLPKLYRHFGRGWGSNEVRSGGFSGVRHSLACAILVQTIGSCVVAYIAKILVADDGRRKSLLSLCPNQK